MSSPVMPSEVILGLSKQYGPRLALPIAGILDPVAVMCAFAENESSFGVNCTPRYEAAYDRGGRYDQHEQAALLDKYGRSAAFSYGPWQTLPCNALSYSPTQLERDPELAAEAFIADMNRRVLPRANTLGEMGQVYNAGHISPNMSAGVLRYVVDLRKNYIAWFENLRQEASRASSIV
jgi:hypothetical protein